ncbi:MAG: hypothetical protein JWR05_3472 [Mucilaginibacter sp.]|nr:hypothetical protein [Mucilaginibacter sp.]
MSAGKLTDFVDEKGFEQLEQVFQKLGIVRQEMIDGIAVARQYNDAIGNTKSLSEFAVVSNSASVAMQNIATKTQEVTALQQQANIATQTLVESTKAKVIADVDASKILTLLNGSTTDNIKLLVEQKAQLAQVNAELKEHSKVTSLSRQSVEAHNSKTVQLTKTQIELKESTAQLTLLIKQQTKEQLAASTSNEALTAQLNQARKALNGMSESEKVNSEEGIRLTQVVTMLTAATKTNNEAQGKFNDNVGNYASAQSKASKEAEKGASAFSNVGKSISGFISPLRQLAYILPGIGLAGLFNLAFEALAKLISELDLFSKVASESEMRQKALTEAFASPVYTTAIENIQKLGVNIDLAKKGLEDSDTVINEYNQTIGKTAGFVDTLTEAQKGFIDNAPVYIDMILKEAAAQLILADNAKFAADTEVKNQKLRNDMEDAKNNTSYIFGKKFINANPTSLDKKETAARLANDQKQINDNDKRFQDHFKNSSDAIESLFKKRNEDQKKLGIAQGTSGTGQDDAIAALRTKLANAPLERQKLLASKLISDEKQSYDTRLKAIQDFYVASKGIADNNEKLATNGIKLSADQKLQIENSYQNEILQLEQTRDSQSQSLKDKAYKQDQQILKNSFQKQKDLSKSILDDPEQSYDAKIKALEVYLQRSSSIIKSDFNEQTREAGQNDKSKHIALQNEQKATIELSNEAEQLRLKIQKETSEKLKKNLEDILKTDQETATKATDILQQQLDDQLTSLDQQKNKEDTLLIEKYTHHKITEKQFRDDLLKIEDQYNVDRLTKIADFEKAKLIILQAKENNDVNAALASGGGDAGVSAVKQKSGVAKQANIVSKADIAVSDAKNKQSIDGGKSDVNDQKDKTKEVIAFAQEAIQALDVVNSLIDQNAQAKIDALQHQSELIAQNAQAEKNAVNGSILSSKEKARENNIIDAQAASAQAKIADQQKKIKQDEAKFSKAVNLAKIIEGTAVAIVSALSIPIYGEALAIVIGAIGAAQLAVVAAQPIPQYFTGTPHSKEGLAHVGERGTELMIDPSGHMSLTPDTDTVTYLKKGTKIINNSELMRMVGKPEPIMYGNGQIADNRKMEKLLEENNDLLRKQKQPVVNVKVGDRWGQYSQTRNY